MTLADDRVRAAQLGPRSQPAGPVRRRWGRSVVGLAAAMTGAFVFAGAYLAAGDRVDAVAVARDVAAGDVIARADLRVVRVSAGDGVALVPATDLDGVVGRVTGADLIEGSLLVPAALRPAGERQVGPDEAVVGLLLPPQSAPGAGLDRGVPVVVVLRPPITNPDGEVLDVNGWVLGPPGDPTLSGERPVSVVVPRSDAVAVSAASAEDRVSVVVLGEGVGR